MQLAEKQELVRLLSLYQADFEIACIANYFKSIQARKSI